MLMAGNDRMMTLGLTFFYYVFLDDTLLQKISKVA